MDDSYNSSRRRFLKNLGLVSGAFATGAFAAQPTRAYAPAYSYSSVPPSSSSSAPGTSSSSSAPGSSSSSSSYPDSSSSSSSSSSGPPCWEERHQNVIEAMSNESGKIVAYRARYQYQYKCHKPGSNWVPAVLKWKDDLPFYPTYEEAVAGMTAKYAELRAAARAACGC